MRTVYQLMTDYKANLAGASNKLRQGLLKFRLLRVTISNLPIYTIFKHTLFFPLKATEFIFEIF